MKEIKLSYEEAVKELEEIIEDLEKETKSLDESVKMFKKGVELYKHSNKLLSSAEGEIKLLLNDSQGNMDEIDFFEEVESDNF